MAAADFGLSGILDSAPQFNLGSAVTAPFDPLQAQQQPLVVNLPRAMSAVQTKYSTYMRDLAQQYPSTVIQSMMDYDAQRVRNGQAPLNEQETRNALQAAQTQQPVTPAPKRGISSPLDIATNAIMDIGDVVKSIPRMPSAMIHEASDLYKAPALIHASTDNPLATFFRAPGIRLIPGAYTAGNIAAGEPGEILRHPVITALDLLPGTAEGAKLMPVAKLTADTVEAARVAGDTALNTRDFYKMSRQADRPISTAMFNKIDPATGLPERNMAGEVVDNLRQTKLGRYLAPKFGKTPSDVMAALNIEPAIANAVLERRMAPQNADQAMFLAAHDLTENLNKLNPTFTEPGVMTDLVKRMQLGNFEGMTDDQLAATELYQHDVMGPMTKWALDHRFVTEAFGEVYDNPTGLRLLAQNRAVEQAQSLNRVRSAVLGGDHMDAVDVLNDRLNAPGKLPGQRGKASVSDRLSSIKAGEVGAKELLLAWQGTRQALRNAGYDTTILDELASVKKTKTGVRISGGINTDQFRTAIADLRSGRLELPPQESWSLDQIRAYTEANMGTGSIAFRDVKRGLDYGEWKGVSGALDSLRGSDPAYLRGIRNARDTSRLLDRKEFDAATDEGVAQAAARLNKTKLDNLAARFLPKADEITRDLTARKLIDQQEFIPVQDQWQAERIIDARDHNQLYNVPGFTNEMFREMQREAAREVMLMKEQGFDPVFVHHVTPNRVEQSLRFGENIVPVKPGSTKVREPNMAPTLYHLGVSANDYAMQHWGQQIREMSLRRVEDQFGYSKPEIDAMVHETTRYRAGKSAALDYEGHAMNVVNERFKALDPEDLGMNWGSPYLNNLAANKVYVPIEVYKLLKSLTDHTGFMGGVFDPLTKAFRISTTALSLRTQVYNIIGGPIAAMLLNPTSLFKYTGEAIRMLKDPTLLPLEMQPLIGSNVRTMLELDDIAKGRVVEGVRKYLVGEKMRAWWDQMDAAKTPGTGMMERFGNKFNGIVQKSYKLNGMVDDFTRMVTYLSEYDKGIAKGWSHEAAALKGVGVARQVLQDYIGMTPFEKDIVKSVIPFYGFIGHAIKFVMRFPLDHPLRAEFMAKLAEAELEDHNQGLPSRFMAMLFTGHQDSHGNQHALNIGPFNPFGDVANSMTLAGFLGNTNPVLQTMFDMVGLQRGTAELYPSLRYDPETGRLQASKPGLVESAISNIIPSSQGILAMIGMNSQYNDMLRRDPAAAGRYLLSSLTIPTLERQYNVPQEQFAAEIARTKSANTVLAQALKTGDWSEASQYPSLVSFLNALGKLPSANLQPYQQQPLSNIQAQIHTAFTAPPASLPHTPAPTPLNKQVQALLTQQVNIIPRNIPVSGLAAGGALGLNGI